MKTSKLLFLSTLLTVAPIAAISSCGEQPTDVEWIANAIFGPLEKAPVPVDDTLVDELYNLSPNDRKAELIYNLYYVANIVEPKFLIGNKTLNDLYKDQSVGIKSVINQATIGITKEGDGYTEFYASFVGYVSFVFLKDYEGEQSFKVNDYIMITYDFKKMNLWPEYSNSSWGIEFKEEKWLGMVKYRYNGGDDEKIIPIRSLEDFGDEALTLDISTAAGIPHNGHNWGPKAG